MAMETHKSRFYFWGNMYLSSIQQGIQAAHVVAEVHAKYRAGNCSTGIRRIVNVWAERDKVMYLLNGGYSLKLREILGIMLGVRAEYDLPYASFSESDEALDGALTCIGIILPEWVYKLAESVKSDAHAPTWFPVEPGCESTYDVMMWDDGFFPPEAMDTEYKWCLRVTYDLYRLIELINSSERAS